MGDGGRLSQKALWLQNLGPTRIRMRTKSEPAAGERFFIQYRSAVLRPRERTGVQRLLSACLLPTWFDPRIPNVKNEAEMLFGKSKKQTYQNKASSQVLKTAKEMA